MKKAIFPVIVIVIAIIFIFPIVLQFIPQKAKINLDKLVDYKVGELVVLDASASKADEIIWIISPKTDNFKIIDKMAIFSSPKAINYTITIVARLNKDLIYKTYSLTPKKVKAIKPVLTPFEQQVKQWLPENNKNAAKRLAASFELIAKMIENGTFETIDGVILATKQSNSSALDKDLETWKPFFQKLQIYLETNPPLTVEAHIPIWRNIAIALTK